MSWSYDGRDPGIALFSACLAAGAPMTFAPGMRVLEVGSCESDWLERASAAWPDVDFVGLDCREGRNAKPPRPEMFDGPERIPLVRVRGNVLEPDIFRPGTFDAVVSLSAIEHVGLGHYGDPLDADGDSKAVAHIWHWLKPGGWFYFDVPYDPTRYYLRGARKTECRVYDATALMSRLAVSTDWRGYAEANKAGVLVPEPTQPVDPFHYVAMVFRKTPASPQRAA